MLRDNNFKIMNKLKVILLVVVVIILVCFLFFYFAFPSKNADVQYEVTEISAKDVQSKLYIKKKVWGMTSDNQVIVISSSNKKEFSSEDAESYVYEGVIPLFYKVQKDTLFVYTLKMSSVPNGLKTNFKIVQVQLENPEMMKLIEHDNYKVQGLTKID
jgi:cytochrome c-type biogenesis protein CcmE